MTHIKWPSIESFSSVKRGMEQYRINTGKQALGHRRPITYKAKVKLHGTNAGIQIRNGQVFAQSRTSIIGTGNDNCGFAAWVESTNEFWKSFTDCTIFGEWCGPGIQKGTAVNEISEKIFAVFAVYYDHSSEPYLTVDPVHLEGMFRIFMPDQVRVLPWYNGSVEVDFNDLPSLELNVQEFEKLTNEVEQCDPWIHAEFNKIGIGEGLVWYPLNPDHSDVPLEYFATYAFKTKGEKHKVVKTKKAVSIDPEKVESIEAFVAMFVTEARLRQFAPDVFDKRQLSQFLKEFVVDVKKESKNELEVSDMHWKDVSKHITNKARVWFLERADDVSDNKSHK